ncbi:MAG: DNA-binding response OmpR family regulator [Bacteroidia bacterium]|jgi:DNA-binding response OmpR family regulator
MKTILVIEDNTEIRENLIEILELDGYKTLEAADGTEGAMKAQEFIPDLILCDIMMPKLDGFGVLHILSGNENTMRIPFIFLTAKTEQTDVRKGMSLGADDYIMKPFDEMNLLTAIKNRLAKYDSMAQNVGTIRSDESLNFEQTIRKNFGKKEIVYREGDSASFIYQLVSGKLKLTRQSNDGKEMVLDLIRPGEYFGYWSVLQSQPSADGAEALEASAVDLIPKADFLSVLEHDAITATKFVKLLSNNLLAKEYKIVELAYNSVRKRVANALVQLSDTYTEDTSKPFSMAVSRETLAGIAGTSIESSIRMLSEFKADGLVEVDKATITILNYNRLKTAPY